MDKGKVIASGTANELKGMIRTGEKITAELLKADGGLLFGLKRLPYVSSVEISGNLLVVKSDHGKNNLVAVLDYLNGHGVLTAGFSASCRRSTTSSLKSQAKN
jgi:ABC-2 type transport system ATP-binding protein